ncbi:MAG: PilZ domain-containing protein [Gammaproteobacteria bacterium]|nr:PilZ domain-containing protein [Gammaproteobacteria bacterium]
MAKDNQERRRFHRLSFDAPAQVVTPRALHRATVVDLSLNGVLLRRPEGWHPAPGEGAIVELGLDGAAASDGPRIRLHGEVAHIEPEVVGLRCRHIDLESLAHLRRLIELNLGDPALLERELSALG